jgi:monoamine oxidase
MQVAVIGLGAAGAYVSRELSQKGLNVHAFEANDHVGGRTLTLQLAEGLYGEMGAEWIDSEHRRVTRWLQSVGIALTPTGHLPIGAWIGDDITFNAYNWPDIRRCYKTVIKKCHEIPKKSRSSVTADRVMAESGVTERALKFLESSCMDLFGFRPNQVTVEDWLEVAVEECEGNMKADEFRTAEGFQEAVRRTLVGVSVNLGWEAKRTEEGLVVTNGSETRTLAQYDAVVLAVSLSQVVKLAGIEASTPEIAPSSMARGGKVVLGFDYPWWRDLGWDGMVVTDKFIGTVWPQQDRPVLCCYFCSSQAEFASTLEDPVAAALDIIAAKFPTARPRFIAGRYLDWSQDRLTGGAFTYIRDPKGHQRLLTQVREKTGALICGEYISSDWYGYVEGALESAERVIQSLESRNRKLGRSERAKAGT